ncbi:MAG: amylo-alpha-1,6-glucosidase, partial [Jatrophihabitans sp.]
YTYAAYVARADLARDLGDPTGERRWRASAAALKAAFNRDFWLADRGWFAVGLDADKRPVDALTSNPGHCLWTGIVEADKAATLAERLGSARMSTGWGLRTLGSGMGAYNPVSYHNGSVWPHDTAICVAGLMRYGHVEVATRLGVGLLEAAARFEHRLPELFCGFGRDEFDGPVPYPTSCSPQAWSAAAPLLVLRALLGLDPDLTTGRVWCAPRLPDRYLPLTVRGVRVGERRVAISVAGDAVRVAGLDPHVTLIDAPRPAEG